MHRNIYDLTAVLHVHRFLYYNYITSVFVLQGDNQYRDSGQALEFKELNIHA